MRNSGPESRPRRHIPFAVILGTNEIASAVAVHLHHRGHNVVLSHDPLPPVIRRRMAFHDALFDDAATVGGITAKHAVTSIDIRADLRHGPTVTVTELGLLDLIVIQTLDILVDARMQKYQTKPDLRRLARLTIGLGPGFCAGANCDAAIETRPGKVGVVAGAGATDEADGISRRLGARGGERFVRTDVAGRWHSAIEIGTRVFKDYIVGHLGNVPVRAPFDGILRGVVRDGTEVPAGAKLLEVDARGRSANWTGIDSRGRFIAKAVEKAIALHKNDASEKSARVLHFAK